MAIDAIVFYDGVNFLIEKLVVFCAVANPFCHDVNIFIIGNLIIHTGLHCSNNTGFGAYGISFLMSVPSAPMAAMEIG